MNCSLKLSMLIALALGGSQAMAMDLGQIQVKSALGQPLLAEIPLHPDSPAELQGLTVQLASSEEFARAGIVGGRTTIPLHFSVANAGAGHPVIRITSSAPVDDPFLDLLIEVNGKAGKSVREYAILLDPPNAQATTAVAATPAPSQPVQRPKAPVAAPVAARPKPVAPAPAPKPAAPVASNGQYGPVERGQTLSGIARSVAPAGVDVQQVMLALKQANPDAFYRDNINALKSGAVLRVPTSAEAQAMTIAAAVAEVRRQNSDWRAGVPGKPAVVADAATRASHSSAPVSAPDTGDRLALVPAKEGSSTGNRGSGAGDKASASLRQDLLRTQESLASLQQQSTDLKTRLKDLADINSKNERLLSLKDNEIAELQAKLAAARKAAGMPPAAASTAKAIAATTPAEADLETATASTAANAAAAPVAAGSTAAAVTTPAGASSVASTPASGASVVTTPIATPAPVKPVEKPASQPAAAEQPWYMQTWAWAAGAGAIVLLILLAMLGRRRKPGAAASKSAPSLADRFGSTSAADQDLLGDDVDQDELLDQLAEHPDDIGLHLELVTLYYSRRDVEHFEAAAEAMHAHITDPQQDEWQDVLHMGEDLVPGHPLFDHHVEPVAHDDAEARGEFDIDDYADESDAPTVVSSMPPLPSNGPKRVSEYNFNFDLTQAAAESASRPAPASDDATVVAPLAADRPAPAEPAASWHFDDADSTHQAADEGHDLGEFNDDPVDTKLDLARAYIDMGDAEGARAMLGEVVKEGSQMQRDVAKRLLDSLH
ncbi:MULTISPECIES: FimV/HubP family polar landmark protein [unclassified Rhodanobacter]|uniref:FimV/HubP family polar landmark protein n=1 Tax=unclassified Rhodanobacter TaxID=2621553 RepID=UPI001BDF1B4B|nr:MULTISPECIES: FimV/HubP family polar landmark protein [unclassified Rhodanobacter]MBT2142856.1 fimbrial protein FimV [Rhodanobacter sp. LX-99]MBT2148071.1 fimbrial protein FimV [Rhodanobacter sp. LX-100]